MKKLFITILVLVLTYSSNKLYSQKKQSVVPKFKKIKVLNVGTFHMGETPDANTTNYDEASKKAKQAIKKVTQAIAKFKPTIILVERPPSSQEKLTAAYQKYLKNPTAKTGYEDGEVQLLGFEIGRLSGTKRIYGIDHKLAYKYSMSDLAAKLNATKFFTTGKRLQKLQNSVIADVEKIGLKNMLLLINSNQAYDFLINANADLLTYANSKDAFEGADEAAKYYKRNLRMYANINKISMQPNDRILIISGGSHAAFFHKFMSRSMVYELEPLSKYLK